MVQTSFRYGAIALACVAFLGCNAPPSDTVAEPDPEPFEPAPPTLAFAGSIEDAVAGRFAEQFNLMATRDIFTVVRVPASTDVQFLRLQILQESGARYTTKWRAFSTAQRSAEIVHPTLGAKMKVIPVSSSGDAATLHVAIPIAGTNFTKFGITGTFTVEASLGAETPEPFAAESFELGAM